MAAPRSVYTVNYFPIVNGGYSMWTTADYDGAQYQADMDLAVSLGFNAMRVFLAATDGVFDYPGPPTDAELDNLVDFYDRSKTAGINLHLTLFDFWSTYGLIDGAQTWADAILTALPDFTNLACIEIKNEVPYSSTATYSGGFDAGWPGGTPEYTEVGEVACVWAQQMIPYIAGVATDVPVVTSCNAASAGGGVADLQALYDAVNGTGAQPGWYEWHSYAVTATAQSSGRAAAVQSALQQVIAVVGDPAVLAIGETGFNSTPDGTTTGGAPYAPATCGPVMGLQNQADYIQATRWYCQQLGLGEPSPWMLFDLEPCAQFSGGQTFGLYTTSAAAKPAGVVYQQIPPGSYAIPGTGINGNMQGTPQEDAESNYLPPRYGLYRGQDGAQPITATVDTINTYLGNPSVLLTGSAETSGGDNPPALEIDPATWPLVTGQNGNTYTFSVALKATGTYGNGTTQPDLLISWYSFTYPGDEFISNTTGPLLTLTDSWQRFSLAATVPAGADFPRVFVRVGYNAGAIWVAGARWSGTPPLIMQRNGWYRIKTGE